MLILPILERMFIQQSLPTAMMIQGEKQTTRALMDSFLQWTCCEKQSRCGQCAGCQMFLARNHPDIYPVEPSQNGHAIKVEQIRDLQAIAYQTPTLSSLQWVVIYQADSMNLNSANAILKILEEPSLKTHFLLSVTHPHLLPKTIQSRCSVFQLPQSYALQAKEEPFIFLEEKFIDTFKMYLEDKKDLSQMLNVFDFLKINETLTFLQYFTAKMIEKRISLDIHAAELSFLLSIPLALWWSFWDHLLLFQEQLRKGVHFQEQLLLSRLFLIFKGNLS